MNHRIIVSLIALLFSGIDGNRVSNGCVTFSVSQGTGCAWMCNYCANKLSTNNYYFTDNVCTYMQGVGCVGSPQAGVSYTCCAAAAASHRE